MLHRFYFAIIIVFFGIHNQLQTAQENQRITGVKRPAAISMGALSAKAKAEQQEVISAESQQAKNNLNLGLKYSIGDGVPQSFSTAYDYLYQAAQQTSDSAIAQEAQQALIQNFERAINQNEKPLAKVWAQYHLGLKYSEGTGVLQGFTKASEYLQQAADQTVSQPIAAEARKALIENFKRAALQQEKPLARGWAHLNLAVRYHHGTDVHRDFANALFHYNKAADQTENTYVRAQALLMLGNLYYNGEAGAANRTKAKNYYEQAANQSDNLDSRAWALLKLGNMYRDGTIVQKDFTKARPYYEQAVQQTDNNEVAKLAEEYLEQINSRYRIPQELIESWK